MSPPWTRKADHALFSTVVFRSALPRVFALLPTLAPVFLLPTERGTALTVKCIFSIQSTLGPKNTSLRTQAGKLKSDPPPRRVENASNNQPSEPLQKRQVTLPQRRSLKVNEAETRAADELEI